MVDEEIALTDIDSGMIISYDELGSKPAINGILIVGAKTSADYGLAAAGASYAKAEEDTLLSAKADKADTYTKAETDAKLGIKADSGDSYTKAEEDALLGTKADTSTLGEYQEKLTAGDNITIANNVISADVPEISEATQSAAGLMSADDKQKVGEIGPIPTDDLAAILV